MSGGAEDCRALAQTIVVDVFLGGRLLAQYAGSAGVAALAEVEGDRAMVALAKQTLVRDRLVDEPHLGELAFKVRRS